MNAIKATEDFVRHMRDGEKILNGGLVIYVSKKDNKKDTTVHYSLEYHKILKFKTKMFRTKIT